MFANQSKARLLSKRLGSLVRIRQGVSADQITTFGIGGTVELLIEPLSIQGLSLLIAELGNLDIPWRVIGAGSNVIIPDDGLNFVLIRLGNEFARVIPLVSGADEGAGPQTLFQRAIIATSKLASELTKSAKQKSPLPVCAFGGTSLMGLSRRVTEAGLSGLEFAAGIPASVGGAVFMNAGAHGNSISEVLREAWVVSASGMISKRDKSQLDFSYRHSNIKQEEIVVAATFCFIPKSLVEVVEQRSRCLEYRKKTQPLYMPSAGSVFRNPSLEEVRASKLVLDSYKEFAPSAGWLIEQVGLRGYRKGGVEFAKQHANWLVKVDDKASSNDAAALIAEAKARVFDTFGIMLENEVKVFSN